MRRTFRNYLPPHGIRVPADVMHWFVTALLVNVKMTPEDAEFVADRLVSNDLRCVFSHGAGLLYHYLPDTRDGRVNPRPKVSVVREAPGMLTLDGDGGLGYFPCWQGTLQAIEKARVCGVAAVTTSNHHHFGAAGIYSRLALEHDCVGISGSAHRVPHDPERMVYSAMDSSPLSIAVPTGEQPPLVLDMSTHLLGWEAESFERQPTAFLKVLGLGTIMQALGGVMAGIYRPEVQPPQSQWEADQGAFIVVMDAKHFMPLEELKAGMDHYTGGLRAMKPFPGFEETELAGGLEWRWEQENRRHGILLSDERRQRLEELAEEYGVEAPFGEYEDTRF